MMKRLLILLLWSLALIAPVRAASLVNVPITTAVTAQVGPTLQVRNTVGSGWPTSLSVSWNFTYGSGGTTVNAWLQTSLDGGTTWCDVANGRAHHIIVAPSSESNVEHCHAARRLH